MNPPGRNRGVPPFCVVEPEHPEALQFVARQRWPRARIAPSHVPHVLGEHGAHVVALDLLVEHRLVEVAEVVAHVLGDIHAGRQFHRAIVGGLDAAVFGKHVNDEVLRPLRINHAEANRQHELRRFESELQRPQIGQSRALMLGQVHLGDKKFHVVADVGLECAIRADRNLVAVELQPGLQAERFLGRQNHDVVFADGVFRFDLDSERIRFRLCRGCGCHVPRHAADGRFQAIGIISWHGSGS